LRHGVRRMYEGDENTDDGVSVRISNNHGRCLANGRSHDGVLPGCGDRTHAACFGSNCLLTADGSQQKARANRTPANPRAAHFA
jgi:hypothetical protein